VALDRGELWRWALVAGLVATALLTHYTGAFVVFGQALWALWARRERWLSVAVAYAVGLVPVLAWLPFAPGDNGAIAFLVKLSPTTVVREWVRAAAGQPYVKVDALPGAVGLVALGLAALAAAGGAVVLGRRWRLDRAVGAAGAPAEGPRLDRHLGLVALLAFATPAGLIAYSLFEPNIYVGRNLIASVPYLYLLVGALLVALPRPLAVAGAALALVGMGIGLVKSFEPAYSRPDWKGVAAYLEQRVQNGDRVVELELFPVPSAQGREPLNLRALQIQLRPGIRTVAVPGGDPRRLAAAGAGHRVVWVVDQQILGLPGAPRPPPIGGGYVLSSRRAFDGLAPIGVYGYERR
jgi:hypothetical protein